MIGERNLAPERGPNVWDREDWTESGSRQRWLLGVGGAAIAITGAALAAVGGTMIYRASVSGREQDLHTGARDETRTPGGSRDVVGAESAASFPASDAPSWTPTIGATPDKNPGMRTHESEQQ